MTPLGSLCSPGAVALPACCPGRPLFTISRLLSERSLHAGSASSHSCCSVLGAANGSAGHGEHYSLISHRISAALAWSPGGIILKTAAKHACPNPSPFASQSCKSGRAVRDTARRVEKVGADVSTISCDRGMSRTAMHGHVLSKHLHQG